ncbi:MAG: hypothetical protein HKN12_05720, partial [Gemmatimonadetes bacterium]|nr:hypothetical protein [Gemmatimonadota bacterium]
MHDTAGLEAALLDLVIILGAAVAVLFLSHRLKLSSVVGLLLTGMLIGPSGLGLIGRESVEAYAELGVVLLLFTVGLEVSLVRLRKQWRPFLLGGGAQVTLTVAATTGIAVAFDVPFRTALFLGFLAALSSTAIVLKMYTDRRELRAAQGTVSTGILLFQDFCLPPLIFLVPVLAGAGEASASVVIGRVSLGLFIVGVAFVGARTVMPRVLEHIAGTRVRELFLLGSLALCLAMGIVTARLGFSLALGAFLAGLIISESEYGHQIVVEVLPLRDVFNSLFFVSVGMLFDLGALGTHGHLILGVGVAAVVIKALIAAAVTGWLGYTSRVALIVGLSLAQMGEFSLVLAGVGREAGLLTDGVFQIFLGSAILTMLVTPLLIDLAPRMAGHAPSLPVPRPLRRTRLSPGSVEEEATLDRHVIVIGYGLNGSNLSRVLSSTGIPFVVVELNGSAVREGQKRGHPVVFGDATRSDILTHCRITHALMLVIGIADLPAARRIVRVAREMNPDIHILVRTVEVGHVEEFFALGANEVIPEEFETSVEIFSRVLERYHVPRNIVRAQRAMIRDEGYRMFRAVPSAARIASERVAEILETALTETFLVPEGSPADGST